MANRYPASVLLGTLLAAASWLGLVAAQRGAPTESSRWTYEVSSRKAAIAAERPRPRLLLVAGSNVLFGVDALAIERDTGVPTVNLATHGGLGLAYLLHQARKVALPGDTLLLALEYDLYASDGTPTEILLDYANARDPAWIEGLPTIERIRCDLCMPIGRVIRGLGNSVRAPVRLHGKYRSETLDARGDETNHRAADRTAWHVERVAKEAPSKFLLTGTEADPDGWERLRAFSAWCRASGVRLLATYPATIHFQEYDRRPCAAALDRIASFYRCEGVPVLGSPQEFMYPRAAFFDTKYHVTERFAALRTRRLVQLLAEGGWVPAPPIGDREVGLLK